MKKPSIFEECRRLGISLKIDKGQWANKAIILKGKGYIILDGREGRRAQGEKARLLLGQLLRQGYKKP